MATIQKETRHAMSCMAAQYEIHNRQKGMHWADKGVYGIVDAHTFLFDASQLSRPFNALKPDSERRLHQNEMCTLMRKYSPL